MSLEGDATNVASRLGNGCPNALGQLAVELVGVS
jgi:hypothetical protein